MRRYMIVANQTLGGDELAKAADARIAAGPCEFWVVVPATLVTDLAPVTCIPMVGGVPVPVSDSPEESRALAQARLDVALERLRQGKGRMQAGPEFWGGPTFEPQPSGAKAGAQPEFTRISFGRGWQSGDQFEPLVEMGNGLS